MKAITYQDETMGADYIVSDIPADMLAEAKVYREKLIEKVASAKLPTIYGEMMMHLYRSKTDEYLHMAVCKGDFTPGNAKKNIHDETIRWAPRPHEFLLCLADPQVHEIVTTHPVGCASRLIQSFAGFTLAARHSRFQATHSTIHFSVARQIGECWTFAVLPQAGPDEIHRRLPDVTDGKEATLHHFRWHLGLGIRPN